MAAGIVSRLIGGRGCRCWGRGRRRRGSCRGGWGSLGGGGRCRGWGGGLPGGGGSRDVAQSVDPACRVVYVDNDPMVLSHVRAFSQSTSQGALVALDGRLTDPVGLLAGAAAALDLGRPVALVLPSTLPFIRDAARAAAVVSAL